jgi:hypothetical protein
MNDDLMEQDLIEKPMQQDTSSDDEASLETVPVPRSLIPHLSETAILLDIDGTLLDLAPTPREVMRLKPVRRWVVRGGRVIAETTPPVTTLLGKTVTFAASD